MVRSAHSRHRRVGPRYRVYLDEGEIGDKNPSYDINAVSDDDAVHKLVRESKQRLGFKLYEEDVLEVRKLKKHRTTRKYYWEEE